MNKHSYFVIFLKKINLSVNSLLQKYLNKLKFKNLSSIASSNKVLLTFFVIIILFLSYLSIPHIYNKIEVRKQLESQLLEKFNLDFVFSKNFNYKFFPRPHFIIKDLSIIADKVEISGVKKMYAFVSLDSLFSLKNISIKNVVLENANFNLTKHNSNFFIKLLDNNFLESSLRIIDSNVFFRNSEKEVLLVNKIMNMEYYYDSKELKNIVNSNNELFNISYFVKSNNDKVKKKLFSSISFNFPKLIIDSEFDYSNAQKKGLIDFSYNKDKIKASYILNKDSFSFNLFDKSNVPKFFYKGEINFNPFYSFFSGNTNRINFSNFFNNDSIFIQLFKTEILNNRNLNLDLNISAKEILQSQNFIDIFFNFKIQEGLIDIDKTKFSWKKYADFEISDSLIYVNDNQLIFNGKLLINIKDYNEIYKLLQISKKLRPELKKLEFNFNYNFDYQTANFSDFKINGKINKKVSDTLKKIDIKKEKLQNKIYFKNVIRQVISAYVG